jgi:hypothetical protein
LWLINLKDPNKTELDEKTNHTTMDFYYRHIACQVIEELALTGILD